MARVVFDLDGTLIDSAPDIRAVANAVLADHGAAPLDMAETRRFVGLGAAHFVTRMAAARGLPADLEPALLDGFMARYAESHALTHPYPGAIPALEALARAGHRIGLCTNKPLYPTRAVLAHLEMTDHFACLVAGDSLPRRKPDPAPLDHAFQALDDSDGSARIFVGDSEVDADTAQALRVPFVLFTQGYRKTDIAQIPHSARFDDFADLPGLIAGLAAGPNPAR